MMSRIFIVSFFLVPVLAIRDAESMRSQHHMKDEDEATRAECCVCEARVKETIPGKKSWLGGQTEDKVIYDDLCAEEGDDTDTKTCGSSCNKKISGRPELLCFKKAQRTCRWKR
eukprot:symbB.v1.2.015021.t1/scaffold1113.1/size137147/5